MFDRQKLSLALGCATAALALAAVPSIAQTPTATDTSMTATSPATSAPLIPREALFGNPSRARSARTANGFPGWPRRTAC